MKQLNTVNTKGFKKGSYIKRKSSPFSIMGLVKNSDKEKTTVYYKKYNKVVSVKTDDFIKVI